jgi:hypothetical protein
MINDDAGRVVRMNTFPEKAFMQGLRTEIVRLSRSGGKSIIEGQSCNVAHRNSGSVGRDIFSKTV